MATKNIKEAKKYQIIDNENNENMEDISTSLFSFIEDVKYMIQLYSNQKYTQAEKQRDKLAEQLDDIMRFGDDC